MRARAPLLAWLVGSVSLGVAAAPSLLDPRVEAVIEMYRRDGAAEALPRFEALEQAFASPTHARDRAAVVHYIGECHWRLGHFDVARKQLERS